MRRVMKRVFASFGLLLLGVGIGFGVAVLLRKGEPSAATTMLKRGAAPAKTVTFTISAIIDGSERFIFTPENVWDEHGRWQPPKEVLFNGEPWMDLSTPPPQWDKLARTLDLPRA